MGGDTLCNCTLAFLHARVCVLTFRLELCNTEMLPEVEKLLSDEMGGVRCSALTALTDLIPLVDKGMWTYMYSTHKCVLCGHTEKDVVGKSSPCVSFCDSLLL